MCRGRGSVRAACHAAAGHHLPRTGGDGGRISFQRGCVCAATCGGVCRRVTHTPVFCNNAVPDCITVDILNLPALARAPGSHCSAPWLFDWGGIHLHVFRLNAVYERVRTSTCAAITSRAATLRRRPCLLTARLRHDCRCCRLGLCASSMSISVRCLRSVASPGAHVGCAMCV